jgi:hypothetical protein
MAIFNHIVKHVVGERSYEIRTMWTGNGWRISIWDDRDRRVGPVYSVALETAQRAEAFNLQPAIDALVEAAKADLDEGRVKAEGAAP